MTLLQRWQTVGMAAAEQWPPTRAEVWRVVTHLVEGCGDDPIKLLHAVAAGLTLHYSNGQWCSEKLSHAVPCATAAPSAAVLDLAPKNLTDFGACLAWGDRRRFALAAHTVGQMRRANVFWATLHDQLVRHTSFPHYMSKCMARIAQPCLNRFATHCATVWMAQADARAVVARIRETMRTPVAIVTDAEHAFTEHILRQGGILVQAADTGVPVLQYTHSGLVMSETDFFLFLLLGAFSRSEHARPQAVAALRGWVDRHTRNHEPTMLQDIMRAWAEEDR